MIYWGKSIIIFIFGFSLSVLLNGCGEEQLPSTSVQASAESPAPAKDEDSIQQDRAKSDEMKKDMEENNQLNLNNGGLIARKGNYYYYSDNVFGVLYRVNLDGTGWKKIGNEPYVRNINVRDGNVYYTSTVYDYKNLKSTERKLYTKTSNIYVRSLETHEVIKSNIEATVMICDPAFIYFTNHKDNNKLYCVDYNFKKLRKLAENQNVTSFYMVNNIIYFQVADGIYKMKADGTQKRLEIAGTNIESFQIFNGNLFYKAKLSNYVYKVPLDNVSEKKILLNSVSKYFIYDAYVYFYPANQSAILFKARMDNTSSTLQRIENSPALQEFTIIGNTLFFINDDPMDKLGMHGFTQKFDFIKNIKTPLSMDASDRLALGIDEVAIADYVSLRVDKEDKNKISLNIQKNLSHYLLGNSMVMASKLIDMNDDKLKELFVIYKQYVSEETKALNGINAKNSIQCSLFMFQWKNNKFNLNGPYPIRLEVKLIDGYLLLPKFRIVQFPNGNSRYLLLDYGSKMLEEVELYRIYSDYVEQLDPNKYAAQIKRLL